VSFFGLLEAANVGRTSTAADGTATKTFDTLTFGMPFASLNLDTAFSIQAGLMVVPFSRQTLASTVHYLTLDTPHHGSDLHHADPDLRAALIRCATEGYPLEGHLEYRFGFFQGIPSVRSRRWLLRAARTHSALTGYVQYNRIDTEAGYTLPSQYFGHKNVLGAGVGFDYQKLRHEQSYWAVSASAFAALRLNGDPKSGGDELAAFCARFCTSTRAPHCSRPLRRAVAKQNDLAAELSLLQSGSERVGVRQVRAAPAQQSEFEAGDLRIIRRRAEVFHLGGQCQHHARLQPHRDAQRARHDQLRQSVRSSVPGLLLLKRPAESHDSSSGSRPSDFGKEHEMTGKAASRLGLASAGAAWRTERGVHVGIRGPSRRQALPLSRRPRGRLEQFFPVLVYRTGPYAPNGVPFANGYVDYLQLVNARDGGINGVKISYEECETGLRHRPRCRVL
jgi:hypothetical protein